MIKALQRVCQFQHFAVVSVCHSGVTSMSVAMLAEPPFTLQENRAQVRQLESPFADLIEDLDVLERPYYDEYCMSQRGDTPH